MVLSKDNKANTKKIIELGKSLSIDDDNSEIIDHKSTDNIEEYISDNFTDPRNCPVDPKSQSKFAFENSPKEDNQIHLFYRESQ